MLPFTIARSGAGSVVNRGRALGGTFQGSIAIARIHRSIVRQWLPRQADLQFNSQSGGLFHPVVFLMGMQQSVHHRLGGFRIDYGFGREYREMIVVVPDLCVDSQPSSTNSIEQVSVYSHLYLTSRWSTALGRFLYGFRKHTARIVSTDDRYEVASNSGRRFFSARLSAPVAEGLFGDTCLKNAADSLTIVRNYLSQPLVLTRPGGIRMRRVQYDFSSSAMTPVQADITFDTGLASRYGRSEPQMIAVPSMSHSQCGAFRCRVPWLASVT